MRKYSWSGAVIALAIAAFSSAALAQEFQPPVAKIVPKVDTMFGDVRVDNYFWLREKSSPEVLKYLEDENNYTALMMKPTEQLQQQLYSEMLGRIKEDDATVPAKKDDYFYYTRSPRGLGTSRSRPGRSAPTTRCSRSLSILPAANSSTCRSRISPPGRSILSGSQ